MLSNIPACWVCSVDGYACLNRFHRAPNVAHLASSCFLACRSSSYESPLASRHTTTARTLAAINDPSYGGHPSICPLSSSTFPTSSSCLFLFVAQTGQTPASSSPHSAIVPPLRKNISALHPPSGPCFCSFSVILRLLLRCAARVSPRVTPARLFRS